jgi:glycosyltransferase involved in cell wall biosynthesis
MQRNIIGTKYLTYLEKRCIALPFNNFEVKREIDIYVLLAAAYLRIKKKANFDLVTLHNDLNLSSYLGFHFWNGASYTSKPWVTTLELPSDNELKLKLFARKQCKKILCLSSWVLDTQTEYVNNSQYASEIIPKLALFHPPQSITVNANVNIIEHNEKIKFMFVGRDLFRKGGFECIKAFDKVLASGYDAELIVVSKMDTSDWPLQATKEQLDTALALIEKWKNNIRLFREIGQTEVISLMLESHVGLLPSNCDSYGFSILEFFSCGIPVITTEVLALSEINHNSRGWLLKLPVTTTKSGVKEFKRDTMEDRDRVSTFMTDALACQIQEILENKQEIEKRRVPALQYVKENHDVDRYTNRLEAIYSCF